MMDTSTIQVAHFRQVLLWPLRLMHQGSDDAHARPWEMLQAMGDTCPWREVAEQAQTRALFQICDRQLGLNPLHAEVKERIADMNNYLEADSLRRQANTVVRLTVVTIFDLIGTVSTGFLGMNLLAEADAP